MNKIIKVSITRQENAEFFNAKVGDIIDVDFEFYVAAVVGSEIGNPPIEAAKAQAIAARSYAWNKCSSGKAISDDSSVAQAFRAYRAESTAYKNAQEGTKATKGMLLYYNGKPVASCTYSDSNGGRTVSSKERWGNDLPYLIAQDDPWDLAASGGVRHGHSVGASQTGIKYAASIGVSYDKILAFYYPGTTITTNYGEKEVISPMPEEEVKITQYYQTRNFMYTKPKPYTPTGILVHSTGCNNKRISRYVGPNDGILGENKYHNDWNNEDARKCMHGFLGTLEDGTIGFYNTLPWTWKCAGCGSGSKGSYNSSHIQFEICEDSLNNEAYFRAVFEYAEKICAYLCRMFNIKVENICGHFEAAAKGYASNHGDPSAWQKKFGDSMDKFRARVAARLGNQPVPEEPEEPVKETNMFKGKYVVVNTQYPEGLNLWDTPAKGKSKKKAAKGAVLFVLEDLENKWTTAVYDGVEGAVDGQYLVPATGAQIPPERYAKVDTKYNDGLNIWKDTNKNVSLKKIPEGTILNVKADLKDTWSIVEFEGIIGHVDRQYLPPYQPPTDNDEGGEDSPMILVDGLKMTITCFTQEQIAAISEFVSNNW